MNNISKLILPTIICFFINSINCQSSPIYSSFNQIDNVFEIQLTKPLYLLNITNLDYLYYDYLIGQSVLNSCIFNTDYFSLNLTNLKGIDYEYRSKRNRRNDFSICSSPSSCELGYQSCVPLFGGYQTSLLNTETFKIGRFPIDSYALLLTYTLNSQLCGDDGFTRNYYFECDETQEFSFFPVNEDFTCVVDVFIKTKNVCPYKNIRRTTTNYSLIQPNILRIILDKSSTNLISFNNLYYTQAFPIRPIIYRCENDGDIIKVNGLFLVENLISHYTFNFGGYQLPTSSIISFNSTTLVLNSIGVADNNLIISLDDTKSDVYPILKPQQEMVATAVYDDQNQMLLINCTNCIGAKLKGIYSNFNSEIIIGQDMYTSIGLNNFINTVLDEGGIYLEAPISPFKRSNIITLPTNFKNVSISNNEIFQFNGSSKVTINGHFIPKTYGNQKYITGALQFLNGTIYNLDYETVNMNVETVGIFTTPYGFGNGTFSIFINNVLVHSNSFSYQPPNSSNWVESMSQSLEKVKLELSFPHSFFSLSSIKYNNGNELDYQFIEPNIIVFTLYSHSSNVISFNNDYHIETISNYRPIIYNYSIVDGILTMDGLYTSQSIPKYKFLIDNKFQISSNQVTYFTNSRISILMDQNLFLYVYSDDNKFTKVPDVETSIDQDNLLFTCSNCIGGFVGGFESQNNQDFNFTEIGTIVKQYQINTIRLAKNEFTFIKDSKTYVLFPPARANSDKSFYKFSTFNSNTILISGYFLFDTFTSFELHFDNGQSHTVNYELLSKSDNIFKYQIKLPDTYGSGNLSTIVNYDGKKSIINSTSFKYPNKPIIHSITKVIDPFSFITIFGDGFFDIIKVVGAFKRNSTNTTDTITCSNFYQYYNSIICCNFRDETNSFSAYSKDGPITIQLRSKNLEAVYFQTYFDKFASDSSGPPPPSSFPDFPPRSPSPSPSPSPSESQSPSPSPSESSSPSSYFSSSSYLISSSSSSSTSSSSSSSPSSSISLHSIISKITITLIFLITILIQYYTVQ